MAGGSTGLYNSGLNWGHMPYPFNTASYMEHTNTCRVLKHKSLGLATHLPLQSSYVDHQHFQGSFSPSGFSTH